MLKGKHIDRSEIFDEFLAEQGHEVACHSYRHELVWRQMTRWVAGASGDAALYDRYMAQLQKVSGQPEEYYRFFNALSAFSDPALVQRTLAFAISPAVRTQIARQPSAWAASIHL